MITCPKCKAEGKYYYDGLFIMCTVCNYVEWAKEEIDGHLTRLWDKWNNMTYHSEPKKELEKGENNVEA